MTFTPPYPAHREPMLGAGVLDRTVMHELVVDGRELQVLDLARIINGTGGTYLVRESATGGTILGAWSGSEVGLWPSPRVPEPVAEANVRARVLLALTSTGVYDQHTGWLDRPTMDPLEDNPYDLDADERGLNPDPAAIADEDTTPEGTL